MGKRAGYTLTEMLVVIAVIGLIAAVVTPGVAGQLGRAKVKAATLQLEAAYGALEAFADDVGRPPTPAEGLGVLIRDLNGIEGWTVLVFNALGITAAAFFLPSEDDYEMIPERR